MIFKKIHADARALARALKYKSSRQICLFNGLYLI